MPKSRRTRLTGSTDDYDWSEHDRVMSRALGSHMQRGEKRLKQDAVKRETLLVEGKKGSRGAKSTEWLETQLVRAPQQTKKTSADCAPPTLKLTADEWENVKIAYANGLEEERGLRDQAKNVPIATRDIQRFLKLWDQLSPMAQGILVGDDELADIYEGKITRYRIEDRADEALWYLTTPRGRPAAIANMRAAEVLADLWRARGGETKPGRLYADKKSGPASGSDYSPNEFVRFVAVVLRCLDPSLKTGRAARVAKSAVDGLHKIGRL
jgi:hypothetical protein